MCADRQLRVCTYSPASLMCSMDADEGLIRDDEDNGSEAHSVWLKAHDGARVLLGLRLLSRKGEKSLCSVDPADEYPVQQLKELDGKMFGSTTKEGLDIADEVEMKKPVMERSTRASRPGPTSASGSSRPLLRGGRAQGGLYAQSSKFQNENVQY